MNDTRRTVQLDLWEASTIEAGLNLLIDNWKIIEANSNGIESAIRLAEKISDLHDVSYDY